MRSRVRIVAFATGLLAMTACASVLGVDGLEKVDCLECDVVSGSSSPDGSIGPGPMSDAGEASAARETGGGPSFGDSGSATDAADGANANDDAARSCPGTAGPVGVRVGSYCIDSTEVTNRQYALFVAAKRGDTSGQPSVCGFNTAYEPFTSWPPATARLDNPVVNVDWCDARMYCAWAGKRLCGAIGGGSSTFGSVGNPETNQWFAACSAGGTRAFANGNSYAVGSCNDYDYHLRGTAPVASLGACTGGYPGISDMNGNVWEWEDGCEANTGAGDSCLLRGGSFRFSGATYSVCSGYFTDYKVRRSDNFDDTGFRCCSP